MNENERYAGNTQHKMRMGKYIVQNVHWVNLKDVMILDARQIVIITVRRRNGNGIGGDTDEKCD